MSRRRSSEMLELTGLADRRHDQVSSLSGGNQQRINIAIGLLGDPVGAAARRAQLGLDPSQRVRLWEFVSGLAEGGTTVIYSTHQIEEASHYGRPPGRARRRRDDLRRQLRRDAPRPSRPEGPRPPTRTRERLRPFLQPAGPLMRWLLLKDLQILRRSPLQALPAGRLPGADRGPGRLGDLAGSGEAAGRLPQPDPEGHRVSGRRRRLRRGRGPQPALPPDRVRPRRAPARRRSEGAGRRRARRPDPARGLRRARSTRWPRSTRRASRRSR